MAIAVPAKLVLPKGFSTEVLFEPVIKQLQLDIPRRVWRQSLPSATPLSINANHRVFRNASQTPSPASAAHINRVARGLSASTSMKSR
jgi:hypothetical protein